MKQGSLRWLAALVGRVGVAALLLPMVLASRSTAQDAPLPQAPTPPPAEEPDDEPAPLVPERPKPPPPTDWVQWNDVVRFRGFSEFRRVHEMHKDSDGRKESSYSETTSSLKVELVRGDGGRLSRQWVLVKGVAATAHRASSEGHESHYHGRSTQDYMYQGASPGVDFHLSTKYGTWRFLMSHQLPQTYTSNFTLSSRSLQGIPYIWRENNSSGSNEKNYFDHHSFEGALETGRPGPIRGVWTDN